MNVSKKDRVPEEEVLAAYKRNKGNIRATAKELGIERSTVRKKLEPLGAMKKPLVGGTKHGTPTKALKLHKDGVKRYILTSAQNNTHVHPEFLLNLEALAEH